MVWKSTEVPTLIFHTNVKKCGLFGYIHWKLLLLILPPWITCNSKYLRRYSLLDALCICLLAVGRMEGRKVTDGCNSYDWKVCSQNNGFFGCIWEQQSSVPIYLLSTIVGYCTFLLHLSVNIQTFHAISYVYVPEFKLKELLK